MKETWKKLILMFFKLIVACYLTLTTAKIQALPLEHTGLFLSDIDTLPASW